MTRTPWSDADAQTWVERLRPTWDEDMAHRVYTSRLIGADPDLVMHGGGNTSLKSRVTTAVGEEVDVLFVKGSGWDLDRLEPPGLPAVRLEPLRRLRSLPELSDEEMVNQLRVNLLDASAPNPSVETLLHAFLPHRFVDHTHADIALVLTNQATDGEKLAREAFGPTWTWVPYVMPGFALAKAAAEAFERDPTADGLILANHGLFTFGDDARTAYERMIDAVARAEAFVADRLRGTTFAIPSRGATPFDTLDRVADLAPELRGALASPTDDPDRPWRRVILEHRGDAEILGLLDAPNAADLAEANPLTPDHVIRTKGPALFVDLDGDRERRARLADAVAAYRRRYERYVDAHEATVGGVTRLDSSPRVVLVPGVGILAAGPTAREAAIAADIAEHTLRAKATADALGRYQGLPDEDLFAMEYWSLEQAKLGKASPPLLAGQIALVTGAAGAIGFGISAALLDAGAHVVVSDLDAERVDAAVAELTEGRGPVASGVVMDVTDEASVRDGIAAACRRYGGLDLCVLNAGIAHVSALADTSPDDFRRVVDTNLTGAFLVLRETAAVLRRQGTGGNVVVNSSKNVFGPGADFGAYSASKAGAHQLGKVAALELAAAGVRVNMINADAVFGDERRPSGLWREVGPARARSTGLEPTELEAHYRERNLLKARITAEHVGHAVVFFASGLTPTTGATLPVDGGVPEAFPR